MKTRAERIRHLREKVLNLTQAELAEKLGVERGSVGNWEYGKPIGRKNLFALTELAGCSPDWIENGVGETPALRAPVTVKRIDYDKEFVSAVIAGMAGGFGVKTHRIAELDQYLEQALKEHVTAETAPESLAQIRAVIQFGVSQFLSAKDRKPDEK